MPQERAIALLVRAPSTEPQPDEGGPRPPLEYQDREDDAKGQAERGLDEEG